MSSDRIRADARVAGEINRAAVLDLLRRQPVTSRVALARASGLSKATITQIIEEFTREGMVEEVGPGPSELGRRPTLLRFNPHARTALGVELGEDACRAVLTDLDAAPLRTAVQAGRALAAEEIADLAAALLGDLPAGRLVGLGLSAPGGAALPSGGPAEPELKQQLASRLGVPVAVVSPAKAAAVGEAWSGAGREADHLVYIRIGHEITAGISARRRLYPGAFPGDGQLGHLTVAPGGELCPCGNDGCLQAVAAGPALLTRVRARLRARGVHRLAGPARPGGAAALEELGLADLAALWEQGDPAVREVMQETADYLGIAVAGLVNLLQPEMVVLGGPVIAALPMLVSAVEAAARRRALSALASAVRIVPAQLEPWAAAVGAAAVLLSEAALPAARPVGGVVAPSGQVIAGRTAAQTMGSGAAS